MLVLVSAVCNNLTLLFFADHIARRYVLCKERLHQNEQRFDVAEKDMPTHYFGFHFAQGLLSARLVQQVNVVLPSLADVGGRGPAFFFFVVGTAADVELASKVYSFFVAMRMNKFEKELHPSLSKSDHVRSLASLSMRGPTTKRAFVLR